MEQPQEPRQEVKKSRFQIEKLEERIAPTANHNPPLNNTNNPGNEGTGGQVSTGP